MSLQRTFPHPQNPGATPDSGDRRWRVFGVAFCLLMLGLHIAGGFNSAGIPDFWRDMYWAASIANGERFPLSGPPIYQLVELGPWWFYLLAVPLWLGGSVVAAAIFIQILAALKYFLAWRIGTRLVDARFGVAFAIGMAIMGWCLAPLMFPSHPALVETTILLLALATWRCWKSLDLAGAALLGLAAAACLHAHPTTSPYIVVAGFVLLARYRSPAAFGLLCVAASIVLLSLLPPWLDRDVAVTGGQKTVAAYAGGDLGVNVFARLPAFVGALLAGGAWTGLLIMTSWKFAAARFAWWLYVALLASIFTGVLALRGERVWLKRAFLAAAVLTFAQAVFVIAVRSYTPIWMAQSCLPPLAFAIAVGWYGWFCAPSRLAAIVSKVMLGLYVFLLLSPFALFLRDGHSLRVMTHANPYFDIVQSDDTYAVVPAAFVPVRRLDALARTLCEPVTLHARLAAAMENTLGTPLRNACGRWPEVRYGGAQDTAPHLAGILPRAAKTTGIAPDRIVARMALYERVRPIAPKSGGAPTRLQRMQIAAPDAVIAVAAPLVFEFDTQADDVVSLTNRLGTVAAMNVHAATAAGRPAQLLYDDGGSLLYRCAACGAESNVHWRLELDGVEPNLDLVVLLHKPRDDSPPAR